MKKDARCPGGENQKWFGNLLGPEENNQSYASDQEGRPINNRATSKNEGGACDSTDRCRGYALHKGFDLSILGKPPVIGCAKENNQVGRRKHGESGYRGSDESGNEIADKGGRNDHRTRCNHGNSDCINELLVSQPMKLCNDTSIEKWHDGKTAPKDECTSLQEKHEQQTDCSQRCDAVNSC